MKFRVFLALALTALLLLTGCGDAPEIEYSDLVTPALRVPIEVCMPPETLSEIVGTPMSLIGVFFDGTQAAYTAEDNSQSVMLNMENSTRALFDEMMEDLTPIGAETDLGEVAWWGSETELLLYGYGCTVDISITAPDTQVARRNILTIAHTVLAKLQSVPVV